MAVRVWLHNLLRNHYRFAQGTTEFYVCESRFTWQRPTEYAVALGGLPPTAVTEAQFLNLDRRLAAGGVAPPDELESEEDDREP